MQAIRARAVQGLTRYAGAIGSVHRVGAGHGSEKIGSVGRGGASSPTRLEGLGSRRLRLAGFCPLRETAGQLALWSTASVQGVLGRFSGDKGL